MGNRGLSAACVLAGLAAGCGDDPDNETPRSSTPDQPPAETPAETSTKAPSAERAADALERLYPDALASTGRTAAERERIRREVASYTTLEATCSPTKRKRVFNWLGQLCTPGGTPRTSSTCA